ncbi:hypothetical protein PP175_26520 (plasmid) [Aneurinibacillus sp. Ricciae_BoGa-3]|uniref:hypothetical protein n=1 Tax=Aneurinibacillus sp. Ricciae_BoGa-3 TaxID=3022697 RepID=UPI00234186B8|nr:hypothetical protein [Aneurinibacillus sp. Ricciae_BoGa-3]WCK57620.1 hypothetical protein PP175_26520 [Aneurinibacillus sp. Ricciae_BoGa-3]
MKTSLDVVNSGYNAIIQNGESFSIVGGKENILFVQHAQTKEITSIAVENVQNFCTQQK